eukprot:285373-Prymnesium_polylepis.1
MERDQSSRHHLRATPITLCGTKMFWHRRFHFLMSLGEHTNSISRAEIVRVSNVDAHYSCEGVPQK